MVFSKLEAVGVDGLQMRPMGRIWCRPMEVY